MSDFGFHKFVIEMRKELLTALVTVNENVQQLRQEITNMSNSVQFEIDAMRQEVQATSGVVDSTKALLASVADMLTAAADDPAEIKAIADSLRAKREELGSAVAAFPGQGGGTTEPPPPAEPTP